MVKAFLLIKTMSCFLGMKNVANISRQFNASLENAYIGFSSFSLKRNKSNQQEIMKRAF